MMEVIHAVRPSYRVGATPGTASRMRELHEIIVSFAHEVEMPAGFRKGESPSGGGRRNPLLTLNTKEHDHDIFIRSQAFHATADGRVQLNRLHSRPRFAEYTSVISKTHRARETPRRRGMVAKACAQRQSSRIDDQQVRELTGMEKSPSFKRPIGWILRRMGCWTWAQERECGVGQTEEGAVGPSTPDKPWAPVDADGQHRSKNHNPPPRTLTTRS